MKINPLDAHDRLIHLNKQGFDIAECCQDMINQKPFGEHGFYIFAHARTDDDGVRKRLIWQPRLTKPKAQTNSMLFKVSPGSDIVRIIWMIPAREMWPMFVKGKITESETVANSIWEFENNRAHLEASEPDDPTDERVDQIYREASLHARASRGIKTG